MSFSWLKQAADSFAQAREQISAFLDEVAGDVAEVLDANTEPNASNSGLTATSAFQAFPVTASSASPLAVSSSQVPFLPSSMSPADSSQSHVCAPNDIFDGEWPVTDTTVEFANALSHHPDTFTQFPRQEEGKGLVELTPSQETHARLILQHSNALSRLRFMLCPKHMTDLHFWSVYFVLVRKLHLKEKQQRQSMLRALDFKQIEELCAGVKRRPFDSVYECAGFNVAEDNYFSFEDRIANAEVEEKPQPQDEHIGGDVQESCSSAQPVQPLSETLKSLDLTLDSADLDSLVDPEMDAVVVSTTNATMFKPKSDVSPAAPHACGLLSSADNDSDSDFGGEPEMIPSFDEEDSDGFP